MTICLEASDGEESFRRALEEVDDASSATHSSCQVPSYDGEFGAGIMLDPRKRMQLCWPRARCKRLYHTAGNMTDDDGSVRSGHVEGDAAPLNSDMLSALSRAIKHSDTLLETVVNSLATATHTIRAYMPNGTSRTPGVGLRASYKRVQCFASFLLCHTNLVTTI
jgi:hypothetical protein